MELVQYIIIGLLTLGAVIFLFQRFRNSFRNNCSAGCECSQQMKINKTNNK